jgi:cell division protein FtsL
MMRWAMMMVLFVALIASSIGVVMLRHETRSLFIASQAAASERDEAIAEWTRLQIELAVLATSNTIESAAYEKLDMRVPRRVGVLLERAP